MKIRVNFRVWGFFLLASSNYFLLVQTIEVIEPNLKLAQNQGGKVLNDNPSGLTSVSRSSVLESQLHTSDSIRAQDAHGSKNEQANGMASLPGQSLVAAQKSISYEKKLQIQASFKQNEREITKLRNGYQSLLRTKNALRRKGGSLKQYCQIAGERTTSEVLEKLDVCYLTISRLKRERFGELCGIGSSITEIHPGPAPETSSPPVTDNYEGLQALSWTWWRDRKNDKVQAPQSRKLNANSEGRPTLISSWWHGISKKTKKQGRLDVKDLPDSQKPHQTADVAQLSQNSPKRTESITKKSGLEDSGKSTSHYGEPTDIPIFLESISQNRQLHDLVLAKVKDQERVSLIEDLKKLLHSVSFPSLDKSLDERNRIARIKVTFEKAILQAVEYTYRNQLITEQEMLTFFKDEKTLKRTGEHIHDLFPVGFQALSSYHTLVPEWNFMITDWHTGHLHDCLKKLDINSQSLVNYTVFKEMIMDRRLTTLLPRTSRYLSIHALFLNDNYLNAFKNDQQTKYDVLDKVTEAINHFWEPPVVMNGGYNFIQPNVYEYWMNYHILNFMLRFGNPEIKKILTSSTKFEKAFKLINHGSEMHQLVNRYFDYGYFLAYPRSIRYMIPEEVSAKGQQDIKQQYTDLAIKYKFLLAEIKELTKHDLQLHYWLNGREHISQITRAIEYYKLMAEDLSGFPKTLNQNLWQMPIKQHEDFEATTYSKRRKTLEHLAYYYNLPRSNLLYGTFGMD